MAYVSALEGGYGLGASVIAIDSSQHAVMVPDADLLFNGAFRRAGPDLILTGHDGRHHTIPGYFSSEHPPALVAPNGASLSAETVGLLAGSPTPGQYAQAAPITPPDAIGHVEKVVGDCTVIRNGAAVTLAVGEAVYKSDVIQTGAGASVGISFPDGTALNLIANTRMALNEYSYDPNSNSNAALMTLVEGTFAFVAGKVAHTGDMKIVTPVATMGIRGTTGVVEEQPATVTSNQGQLAYSFAVVQDFGTNVNGAYTLCYTDPNTGACQVFTTISQTGYLTLVTPQGIGQAPTISVEPISGTQLQFEQQITQQLFELLSPVTPTPNSNGSSTPQPYINPNPNPQQYDNNGTPLYVYSSPPSGPTGGGPPLVPPNPSGPTAVVVWLGGNGNWDTATSWSDGFVASSISLVEIFAPVTVTVSDAESAGGLDVGTGATVDIVNGGTLTISDEITGAGTVELNSTGSDPTLVVDGTVTLKGGGTILMTGTPGDDNIVGLHGSGAKLVNVDYTITGAGTIGHDGDGNLTFVNEGTVDATGLLTIDTGNEVANTTTGLLEATAGGTLQIDDDVGNCGIVEATGAGATVSLLGSTFDNMGSVLATHDGAVTLSSVFLTNETGGIVTASDGGSITYDTGNFTNDGSVLADGGSITFEGSLEINNNAGATFEATAGGSITLDGADGLSLTNLATIEADNGGTITFDQVAVTNYGAVIEAEAGGTIVIETDGGPAVFGGTIQADGSGSTVQLETASLNDLTLESSDGGEIEAVSGTSTLLNDTFDGTTLNVESGATVNLSGGSSGIAAVIDGTVTFEGAGSVTLDFSSYQIVAGGSGAVLDDYTTISGSGQIGTGNDELTLNIGSPGAIETVGSFVINTGDNVVNNAGLLEALSGGTLTIDSGVNNPGTIEADGGTITITDDINSGVGNSGLIEALDHGTITITAPEGIPNLADGTIKADDGTISITASVANGAGSSIGNQGLAEALNGGSLSMTAQGGGLSNQGTIKADGGTVSLTSNGAANGITNSDGGVIEACNGGTVTFIAPAGVTNAAGGMMKADGGTLTFDATGGVTNDTGATIEALNGGTLQFEIATTLDNAGAIDLTDGTLALGGNMTLDGGGTVTLSDDADNAIKSDGSAVTLTNDGNTIAGAGTIGDAHLTLVNETHGTIDADDDTPLILDTGANTITNQGLLEATLGGTLEIKSNVTNTGGEISASGTGSAVNLIGVTITGGTLASSDGGVIETLSGTSTLSGVTIDGGSTLETNGDSLIDFQGTTTLQGGTVTLEGGGTFVLSGTGAAIVGGSGSGAALDNEGTLTGAGDIGNGGTTTLSLTNDGTIDANVSGGTLTIETGSTVTNNATMEATDGGALAIDDSITNEADASITASGAGSSVTFDPDTVTNDGQIGAASGGTVTFDDSQVGNYGQIGAASGGTVTFDDSHVTNESSGNIGALSGGEVKFEHSHIDNYGQIGPNGGTVIFDHSTIHNYGGAGGETIEGIAADSGGSITFQYSDLVNCGAVTSQDGSSITFKYSSVDNTAGTSEDGNGISAFDGGTVTFEHSHVDNSGEIRVFTGSGDGGSAGTLYVDDSTIDNAGGTISVIGAGDTVQLSDATIQGGTLFTDQGGVFDVVASADGPTLFDGSANTLTIQGAVDVENGANLALAGTITDNGTITLEAGGDPDLVIDGAVTLNGSGTVVLSGSGDNIVGAATGSNSLDNEATIEGAGAIGNGGTTTLALTNDGTIDADVNCQTLTIDTGAAVDNNSLLEATNGATLKIDDSVDNACGATIKADGATVDLNGGYTNHGTIETADCGIINIAVDDGDGINCGMIEAVHGTINITVTGYAYNYGTEEAGAGGTLNIIRLDTVVMQGAGNLGLVEAIDGGTINYSGSGGSYGTIEASGCGSTVTFNLAAGDATQTNNGGTMEALRNGAMTFNGGTINNNYDADTETAATVKAASGGTVTVNGSTVNNTGGSIFEALTCGILTFDCGATINNHSGAMIEALCDGTVNIDCSTVNNGGGYVEASGHDATVNLAGVTINGGTLETSCGGLIQTVCGSGNSTFDNVTIAAGSAVLVNDGTSLTLQGTVDNNGTITLAAATDPSLVIDGTVTLSGDGVIVLNGCGDCIVGVGGDGPSTLDSSNTIAGAGMIGGGNLVLVNEACGTVDADVCGATLTIDTGDNQISNLGTLEATGGGILAIDSSLDNSNLVLAQGHGSTITVSADVTNESNAQIEAESCGTITFDCLCFTNDCSASIVATTGGVITFDHSHLDNYGAVSADCGGSVTFCHGTVDNYGALIDGSFNGIQTGEGGTITFDCTNVVNTGCIEAGGGSITFDDSCVNNSGGAIGGNGIVAFDGGSVTFEHSHIVNTGTIGAFTSTDGGAAGTVYIDDSTVDNMCGVISAIDCGDTVQLSDATICGGTLLTSDGGLIEVVASADGTTLFDGTDHTLTVEGAVQVEAGAALALAGTIDFDNGGTITLLSGSDPDLVINGTVTLDSEGDGSGGVVLSGSSDAIVGAGGDSASTLDNAASISGAGMIGGDCLILVNEAGGIVNADVCGQTLDISTGHDVSNAGTLEATNGGTLAIADDVRNSGLVSASCGGTLDVTASSITWTGDTATAGTNGIVLDHGTLLVDSTSLTLGGGGAVSLDCGTISAATCGDTLYNADTITGTGTIGSGGLVLVNQLNGTIDANVSGQSFVIDTGHTVTNDGTLKATSGGTLQIDDSVDNSGTIVTVDSGIINFDDSSVSVSGSGEIGTVYGGTINIDDSCVNNGATIETAYGGTINFDHSSVSSVDGPSSIFTNTGGTINFDDSSLDNGGTAETVGSGTINFDDSCVDNSSSIDTNTGGTINFDDSCVDNTGYIGTVLDLDILAPVTTGTVTFDHSHVDNGGTIEAAALGTVALDCSTVDNVGGTISAIGSGATVQLSDATICGGTLATSDNGLIEVVASDDGTTLFDGTDNTVTVEGAVQVEVGAALALAGTIDFDNGGAITLLAGSDTATDLVVNGTVTLDSEGDGSGGVVLDGAGDAIVGDDSDGGSTLHNDATISGAGTIGGDGLILVNEAGGTINADVCGQTLSIDTGHDISNAGVLEATNGGTLQIADDVCNSGLVSVSCGGTLDVTASSITWTGDTATAGTNGIMLDHGTLLVDSASLTLDGGGAVSLDCGTISSATSGNTLYNADSIVGTGTIGSGGLVLNNEGCGGIDANVSGGTLTLDTGGNTIVNAGTLQAENGGTLDIKSMVDNCGGTLVANSGGTLDAESCVTGGSAMITGGTLEFGASSNVNVTFCNGSADAPTYGTLVLGDAADFSGQINGFTGTSGDAAHSDTVELAGICETSWCAVQSGDNEILTINYGDGHQLSLTFDDFSACFTIVTTGGNTYIYDPPASGGAGNGPAPGPAHLAGGPVGVVGAVAGGVPAGTTGALVSASTTASSAPVGTTGAFVSAGTTASGAPVGTTGAFMGATSQAETATLNTIAGLLSEFVGSLGVPLGTVGTLAATSLPLAADPLGTTSAFVGSSPAATGWTHTTGTTATPTVSAFVSAGGDDVTGQTSSVHTAPQNDSAPTPTVAAFVSGAVPTSTVGALVPAHHDGGPIGAIGALTSTGAGNDVTGHTSTLASTAPQNEAAPTPTVSAFVAGESTPTPTVGAFVHASGHGDGGPVGAIGSIGGETAGTTDASTHPTTSVDAAPHTAGVAAGIGLNFGTDQFVPAPSPLPATGGSTNHVGAVSVALGGAGHDAFVFNSVAGPDGFVSAHAPGGSTEVDHVANVQPVVPQLVAFLTEIHATAAVEAAHNDVSNAAMDQFHQIVASVGHLH